MPRADKTNPKFIMVDLTGCRYYITLICRDGGVEDDISSPLDDRADAESRAITLAKRYQCPWERGNYSAHDMQQK